MPLLQTKEHLIEKTTTNGLQRQTTSTPYDNPIITISPSSTNSSFIGTSQIRAIDDNHADSFAISLKVPNMTSLLNGVTSTSNKNQDSNQRSNSSSSQFGSKEMLMRMSKVTINEQAIDEEIRIREKYLNQLKSIDLSKYSFPNE